MKLNVFGSLAVVSLLTVSPLVAQAYRPDPAPGEQGSSNIHVVGHLPLNVAAPFNTSDIEIEQELSRPYVYVDHANEAGAKSPRIGFDIISIKDVSKPRVIYSWQIETPSCTAERDPSVPPSSRPRAATTSSTASSSLRAGRTWTSAPSSGM